MKNFKRNAIITLFALMIAALAMFSFACSPTTAVLSYEVNGGEAIASEEVSIGETVTLKTPAARTGYEFSGWYLTSDFSGDAVTTVTVNEGVTVYANWTTLYAVTLDLNGGEMSGATTIYLKQGSVIYDSVSSLTPSKAGYIFGAWFLGTSELNKSLRIGTSGITLTAEYKAPYDVRVYAENISSEGAGYSLVYSETLYEYVGKTVELDYSNSGYTLETDNTDNILSATVQASGTVLQAYYTRNAVSLTFNSNYPDGTTSVVNTVSTYYGVETEIPDECYYELDGYFLKGWATTQTGDVVYESNYLERKLSDGSATTENDSITPERSMVLYAVWEVAYTDMLGGEDFVFVTESNAYLCRGGFYFKCEYYPNGKSFQVTLTYPDGQTTEYITLIESKHAFIYRNSSRAATYYLYSIFEDDGSLSAELSDDITLTTDGANGVTYRSGDYESTGTYVINDDGYLVVTYTEGELAGTEMTLTVGTVSSTKAFQVRNDEEYNMGTLVRFGVNTSAHSLASYSLYEVILNGFGTAVMHTSTSSSSNTTSYYYTISGDTLKFWSASYGTLSGTAKLMTYDGAAGYMLYNSDLDMTATDSSGNTLTMDGLYNITYSVDGKSYKGLYVYSSSYISSSSTAKNGTATIATSVENYIISTLLNSENYKFYLSLETVTTTDTATDAEGNETTQTNSSVTCTFTVKPYTCAEYLYETGGKLYYAPFIVLDDEVVGTASVYGYDNTTKTYKKVLTATYTEADYDGKAPQPYLFTVTAVEDPVPEVSTSLYDLSTISSFVCVLDDANLSSYYMSYWLSVTFADDTTEDLTVTYYPTDGSDDKLILIDGIAYYYNSSLFYSGFYEISSNVLTLTVEGSSSTSYYYFELDTEAMTYSRIVSSSYTMTLRTTTGSSDSSVTMLVESNNTATYSVASTVTDDKGNSETVTTETTGAVTSTGVTSLGGSTVYLFTADDGSLTFAYIMLYSSSSSTVTVYFAKYTYDDTDYQGATYTSATDGRLSLDGFDFYAKYIDSEGNSSESYYVVLSSENSLGIVRFTGTSSYYYFDLYEGNTFSAKGSEYSGSETAGYIVFDNQKMTSRYIWLDGHGNALVYEYVDSEKSTVDDSATYTVSSDSVITVTYTGGTYTGKISTFTYSSYTYLCFELIRSSADGYTINGSYLQDSDYTVIILDEIGKATRYGRYGAMETGTYKLITEDLFYYVNDDGDDACIYSFDPTTREVTLCVVTKETDYYTAELSSLVFTKYGFVIKDGSLEAYYVIDDAGSVTLYTYDEDSDSRNYYNFVESSFGTLEDTVTYDGSEYYKSSGAMIPFVRTEGTGEDGTTYASTDYPYSGSQISRITFTPTYSETYSIDATVTLTSGTTETTCSGTVYRTTDGTYLVIAGDDGYSQYQFKLGIKYGGDSNSEFYIESEQLVTYAVAYTYARSYYLYYYYFGSTYASSLTNSYGIIEILKTYNTDGTVASDLLYGVFGTSTGYVDTLGNLLTFSDDGEAYKYDESTGLYTVEKVMDDGYTYQLRFVFGAYLQTYYAVYGFIRVQTLTDGDYTVTSYKVVASDAYSSGTFYNVELKNGDKELPYDTAYVDGNVITYVVRENSSITKAPVITKSTYYTLTFTEVDSESTDASVPAYSAVTVTSKEYAVYYSVDTSVESDLYDCCYIEFDTESDSVISIVTQKGSASTGEFTTSTTRAKSSVKNDDGTYTVTTSSKTYTVSINSETKIVTVTEVTTES